MNNILQLLDQVKERITAYGYSDFSENIRLWGGADVIISPTLTEDIESWLGDQPIVISAQTLEPGRRAVITKYASALSWLFYELKYIFSNSIDAGTKYDFYGMLAIAANECIENNKDYSEEDLLLAVVKNGAKKYYKSLMSHG